MCGSKLATDEVKREDETYPCPPSAVVITRVITRVILIPPLCGELFPSWLAERRRSALSSRWFPEKLQTFVFSAMMNVGRQTRSRSLTGEANVSVTAS